MALNKGIVKISVALMASGTGSNVKALLDHNYKGKVRPDYRCLITNNSRSGVMILSRERGIPSFHVSSYTHPVQSSFVTKIQEILFVHQTELIVLAGYMKRLPREIVTQWRRRILNIHPALLPGYGGRGMYGLAPHHAVLAARESKTGVTVHLVDEDYDTGPILAQRMVKIFPSDDAEILSRRVKSVEHETYWRVVEQVVTDLAAGQDPAPTDLACSGYKSY